MKYAVRMILDTSISEVEYSKFDLLIEEDLSGLDLEGFKESDDDTEELELKLFESCPYIKLHKSFDKVTEKDNNKFLLERVLTFSIEDTFNIRQQIKFLNRFQFSNYEEIKIRLLDKIKNN